MPASSAASGENARKLLQSILQRVALAKNQCVADAIGCDDSTVSRIISGDSGVRLNVLHPFLASLGLKVVPAGHICVDAAEYHAKDTLLRKLMEREPPAAGPQVDWER